MNLEMLLKMLPNGMYVKDVIDVVLVSLLLIENNSKNKLQELIDNSKPKTFKIWV